MKRPSNCLRREEEEEEIESGSEFNFGDMENDMFGDARSENGGGDDDDNGKDEHEVDSDDLEESLGDESDEEEEDEVEGELEDDEEKEDGQEGRKSEEMQQLEKEYMELRNQEQEQDVLWNLKRHKDQDILKGQAVKNQKALWDKILEFRILLQKAFSSSNRLPQEPFRSSFCTSGDGVSDAYSDLINSSKNTLASMLELQEALLERNPAIAQFADVSSRNHSKHIEASQGSNGEGDEEWSKISQMQSRMAGFRDKSIDKWHRKSQMTTGAAAIKAKLQAFNQNISEQVAAYMRDPSKMIKGMQQNRSAVALFGTVVDSLDNIKQEGDNNICKSDQLVNADGDPELLDDSQFYGQLLKEFLESSEAEYYTRKIIRTKKRKIVDRRASKSRKIRYHVHEKIVNFMAPQPQDIPDVAPKLFQNLFGLRNQMTNLC